MKSLITGFIGPRGAGKDLGMTYRLEKRKNVGDKILTNYTVNFSDGLIDSATLLEVAKNKVQLKKCSIGLSEIHLLIEPRRSSSNRTVLISYVISQTRKRTVRVYYNCQTLAQIEKRLLEMTDYLVICRRIGKNWFYYRVLDVQNGWKTVTKYVLNGKKLYGKYSTEQIITDFDPALLESKGGVLKAPPRKHLPPKRPKARKQSDDFDLTKFPAEYHTEHGLEGEDIEELDEDVISFEVKKNKAKTGR